MQIHDLNEKTLTNPAYVAFDDGEDTYKTEFNECVENAANAAVAAADLTENEVAFTSGDAASPTAWSSVSVLTSGSTLATLFNRISTMVKNVRWLYSKLGTTDISSIGGGTVTGAISALNGKLAYSTGTFAKANSNIGTTERTFYTKFGRIVVVDLTFIVDTTITESTATLFNGLPPAERTTRFRISHGYNASVPALALCVTTAGVIANQWSNGGVQTGQWSGQFAYIAQS